MIRKWKQIINRPLVTIRATGTDKVAKQMQVKNTRKPQTQAGIFPPQPGQNYEQQAEWQTMTKLVMISGKPLGFAAACQIDQRSEGIDIGNNRGNSDCSHLNSRPTRAHTGAPAD